MGLRASGWASPSLRRIHRDQPRLERASFAGGLAAADGCGVEAARGADRSGCGRSGAVSGRWYVCRPRATKPGAGGRGIELESAAILRPDFASYRVNGFRPEPWMMLAYCGRTTQHQAGGVESASGPLASTRILRGGVGAGVASGSGIGGGVSGSCWATSNV